MVSPNQNTLAENSAEDTRRPPTELQVLPALVTGGVERGTVDIANAIVAAGGRAIVVSAGGPMVVELTRGGAEHITLPIDTKNIFAMRKNIKRLAELIVEHSVDIVHARSRAPAWSAYYAAKRTNRHFITTFHGTYGHGNWLKRWYNSIMIRGEQVIAISDFIGGHVRQIYGVPATKIKVIHRGIDLERFDTRKVSAQRVIDIAKKWRLPDGKSIVMLPGRLTRWKGQIVFIEAVKKLNLENVQCLMVGSDQGREDYRRELESEIERHGMDGVIHVIDHCDDMPAAYMLTDIVVSASTEPEAFGRVVAEAQALGRPVIATNHGGAKETIIEGQTGWLTPPGDADALAEAIKIVLDLDEDARTTFAERAIQHIRDNYSKADMCARTLDVYNSVLVHETDRRKTERK